ncbi:hypothetical protein SAMN04488541_101128 [Thermoflexibacter ruber]|uniref:Uncharacterized protein n=1 Tax=Thermoflexibacter ruber TaxID=1003 RepID=A0A1I2EUX4_9BACT|nr:hypothetical protein SAMN04488541_101128 [Thermoflexibacter ruber]
MAKLEIGNLKTNKFSFFYITAKNPFCGKLYLTYFVNLGFLTPC